MIEITEAAKSKIKEILYKNPGKYLRLIVEGDGCAGPYLGLSLDEPNSDEKTTRVNGIDILISDEVKRHAEVTTINIFINHIGKDSL
jgi:Fe-S cluster assembly iron-binding protein IscA